MPVHRRLRSLVYATAGNGGFGTVADKMTIELWVNFESGATDQDFIALRLNFESGLRIGIHAGTTPCAASTSTAC